MAKRFRLAVSYKNRECMLERPPLPEWLKPENKERSTRNQKRSFRYWTSIYWATPPWINERQIEEMRQIYLAANGHEEVDHIVPLCHPLVCGLHVPWNLEAKIRVKNQKKSNNFWPDMPGEQPDMFGDKWQEEQYALSL